MTQEQLVYYAKKLQEEWSLEQLIEKVFLNNNEVGSPTTHVCPVCASPLESRGGYIRVIIGKRDMTSGIQGASWYCAKCDRVWDFGDLPPSNTRQLADTDACDRLRWLLAQAERVVRVEDADRAAVDRACRLMAGIDNGFDRVRG